MLSFNLQVLIPNMRGEDCPTGRAKTCWRFFVCYVLFGSYVVIFPRVYSYWRNGKRRTKRQCAFFLLLVHHRLLTVFIRTSMEFIECGDVWSSNGRKPPLLITSRQMCLKHLYIPGFELVNWIIGLGSLYDFLLCICMWAWKLDWWL